MTALVLGCDRRETDRVVNLRQRVRAAMEQPPEPWSCPPALDPLDAAEPVCIRRARAVALKLSAMPDDLWPGQLFAGSMTLESPRVHAERGFPEYLTPAERRAAGELQYGFRPHFGHIVPDYPRLLAIGLDGILEQADRRRRTCADAAQAHFLESVRLACEGVITFAHRLARRCEAESAASPGTPLVEMAENLHRVPAEPPRTFWQALQAVWLMHLAYHATGNGNALGRLDQYAWPFLQADLACGRLTIQTAGELVDLFCLKFNERAVALAPQRAELRRSEEPSAGPGTRHGTSSQLGARRDHLDAANHWLQNIIIGGLTPAGADGGNLLTHLLLDAYHRNRMTNPLVTVRLHRDSPVALFDHVAEVLCDGGGMPAVFNDETLVPALCRLGLPVAHARDYTNDGCWEVIIPGRTDFCFQRLSLMLCLEWALRRGQPLREGMPSGIDTGDAAGFTSFDQLYAAWAAQLDAMVGQVVEQVVGTTDHRQRYHPVPLVSALVDGCLDAARDLAAGGARHQLFGMLAEGAAHCIDSLTALAQVVYSERAATLTEVRDALETNFEGRDILRHRLKRAPKYGNAEPAADAMGRRVVETFVDTVRRHASRHETDVRWPCGVATFSWYLGIGQGLGASPDGRRAGEPVSSNFSPALGRDTAGLPSAILSYAAMPHHDLPAGGPLDVRVPPALVHGEHGAGNLASILRGFIDSGGSMLTVTVADAATLRAAQLSPEQYDSLRVRMGGWCAYFTLLSPEQQEHQIGRQEGLG